MIKQLQIASGFFCLLFFTVLLFSCQNSPDSTEALMAHYQENGRREIGSPFSGAVLITKNGQTIFKGAYGLSDREANIPNTIDTKFPIGSVTKQFTAMLVMQMVEMGKLSLSDTIRQHLPYLTSDWSNEVTIHHLLSHTSGLPHYEGILGQVVDRDVFAKTAYTPKDLALLIDQVSPVHPTNMKFHYSSLGYLLLGTLLEEVTGQSYGELLHQYITSPLGLKNTGFESNEFIKQNTAKGYAYVED